MNTSISKQKESWIWQVLVGSSLLGLVASFIQLIERIQYADNPTGKLFCDINATFSCNNVFASWQSSVFGFSNTILCLTFFSIIFGAALVGVSGGKLNRTLRLCLHFFSLFFLGFGAWYLWQSTFVINSICIFCLFCYAAVILMNATWFRINAPDLPFGHKTISRAVDKNIDLAAWLLWTLALVGMMVVHFGN